MKCSITLLAATILFIASAACQAQTPDPSRLAELPPPARVLADIRGKDPLDTLARQVAAMNQLHRIVEDLADDRRFHRLTEREQQIMAEYWSEAERLRQEAIATFDPAVTGSDSPRAKWFYASGRYERDEAIRDELLKRYFTTGFRDELQTTVAAADIRLEEFQREEALRLAGKEPGTWDRMTRSERESATNFAIVMGVLIGLCLLRELRKFGLTNSTPPKIRAGFRLYRLSLPTGPVRDFRAWTETTVSVTERINGFGQVLSRDTWTSSVYHEAFTIEAASGTQDIKTTGTHSGINNGDVVTAVMATRRLRKTSEPVLFRNLSQGKQVTVVEGVLGLMLKVTGWLFLLVTMLAFMLGSSTDMMNFIAPRGNGLLRGLLAAFIAPVALLVITSVVNRLRVKRFSKRSVPKLLPYLDAVESGQLPAPPR